MLNRNRQVPLGRTLSTNDAYLGKQKTGSKKTRPVVVVDTNNENLAVVPLSTTEGKNRRELKGYDNPITHEKTYFKEYLEIEDNEGKPIRVNKKFRENHKNMDVPIKKVMFIRHTIFNKSKVKQRNQKLLIKFKGKKNDWDWPPSPMSVRFIQIPTGAYKQKL